MDLIYANSSREDIGVIPDYDFDLAFGSDENDFELTVSRNNHCCEAGDYIYIEGTEYGGIVDAITSDTAAEDVTYSGRTWHGILNSKILCPDAGESYLTVSGDANTILGTLLSRMGLTALFSASSAPSGINVSGYQFARYVSGYDGIRQMLKSVSAKLRVAYSGGSAVLSAAPIVDYTQDGLDSDQLALKVKKTANKVNHLICLGSGELANRTIVHLYADASGNISQTQTFTGTAEYTTVYDYSNAEDTAELIKGGTERLKELLQQDDLTVDVNEVDDPYDVGDIVGASDDVTGVTIAVPITKKIIRVQSGIVSVDLETDIANASGYSGSTEGGGSSGGGISLEDVYPVGAIYISAAATNPGTLFGFGTWEQIKDVFLLAAGSTYSGGSTGGEETHTLTTEELPKHEHKIYYGNNSGSYFTANTAFPAPMADSSGNSVNKSWGYELCRTALDGGSDTAHNNMPPYLAVYVWKRTA